MCLHIYTIPINTWPDNEKKYDKIPEKITVRLRTSFVTPNNPHFQTSEKIYTYLFYYSIIRIKKWNFTFSTILLLPLIFFLFFSSENPRNVEAKRSVLFILLHFILFFLPSGPSRVLKLCKQRSLYHGSISLPQLFGVLLYSPVKKSERKTMRQDIHHTRKKKKNTFHPSYTLVNQ